MNSGKGISSSVLAIVSALASMACCLPFGFLAVLGAAGVGFFLQTHRAWLLVVSVLLLATGFWQQRRVTQCGMKRSPVALTVLWTAVAIVLTMAFFPQVIAGIIANFSGAPK